MGRLTQRARIQAIYACLTTRYPDVSPFLHHASPFQLLIAVILSAQCTDQRVNQVTPGLFERFPTPKWNPSLGRLRITKQKPDIASKQPSN